MIVPIRLTSKELLLNQTRLPDKESIEYLPFWENEREKLDKGVYVEGELITPFLYWHINYWNTEVDYIDSLGRVKQQYSNPLLRDNEWKISKGIWRAEQEKKGLIVFGIRRAGKDLLNSSKLYTEENTIEIGNAKIGNKIYDDNGELTTITGVFPQGIKPVYKITLRDGRELFCGLDHNWEVIEKATKKFKRKSYSYYKTNIKTTRELIESGIDRPRIHNGYKDKITRNVKESKYWIRNNKPVNYKEKNLEINPYWLGLYLGDGITRNTGITTMDEPIVDFIKEYANELNLQVRKEIKKEVNNASTYHITTGYVGKSNDKNILINKLKNYKLIKNKHIPKDYLYSSFDQRLALLQGLLDSDGTCLSSGQIQFTSSITELANDFYQLVRSLGISCSKKQKRTSYKNKEGVRIECKISNIFSLYTELPVFKLQRKLDRMVLGKKGFQPKINKTAITKIEYVFDDYTTCITVDNKQSLFLTDDYTITHNSVFASSYIGMGASLSPNSQNVLAGTNGPDIKLITDKLDKGLNHVPEYFQWQRVEDNWNKQVTLGVKEKGGKRYPFSYIMIRNLDGGANEEAIAGTKPEKLLIDEAGKSSFLKGFQAAIPGFTTPFGWICSPIVTGTGGQMDNFLDAKTAFTDPAAYNFVEYLDEKSGAYTGLFIGHTFRQECKIESTLGNYLKSEEGSDLYNIKMSVSDEVAANKFTDERRAKLSLANDETALLKEIMYFPKNVDEIFMNATSNLFPIEAIRQHINVLKTNKITGHYIWLYKDIDGTIKHKYAQAHEKPVNEWPVKSSTNKKAPIQVWEFPISNPPYGLYVAGADPYNISSSYWSTSLGVCTIFKRMLDISTNEYVNMIVAQYAARPDTIEEWHENAYFLLKWYNAVCFPENEASTFIQYFNNINESPMLADGLDFLKEFNPTTKTLGRVKGAAANPKNINHMMADLYSYCREEIVVSQDENGNNIKKLGVTRIPDVMILEEMIGFRPTNNGVKGTNSDRIVALRHAISYAKYLDKYMPTIQIAPREETPEPYQPRQRSPFLNIGSSPFLQPRNPFGNGY